MKDVERLWAAGLALGASLENTVAIGDDRIINREGLRYSDEFVRHKALDAVGDLALAGAPILGAYASRRGGHRLNSLVLKALFADAEAWTLVEAPRPFREVRHAELSHRLAAANFAAERS
jgi:UDP-3-O-[3-hydroxymyristoyl] N-acetylglucosamine deacetylase